MLGMLFYPKAKRKKEHIMHNNKPIFKSSIILVSLIHIILEKNILNQFCICIFLFSYYFKFFIYIFPLFI